MASNSAKLESEENDQVLPSLGADTPEDSSAIHQGTDSEPSASETSVTDTTIVEDEGLDATKVNEDLPEEEEDFEKPKNSVSNLGPTGEDLFFEDEEYSYTRESLKAELERLHQLEYQAVFLQYASDKRTECLRDLLGGRLTSEEALEILSDLEEEQQGQGLLTGADTHHYRQIKEDIREGQKKIDKMTIEVDTLSTALAKAMKEVGLGKDSDKKKKKDHEPPTLSDVNAIKWKTFRHGFQLSVDYNEWTDAIAVTKLRLSMKDEAARAVEHVTFAAGIKLEDALNQLEEIFVHPSGQDLAEVEFKRARRKREETFQAFHIRLRNLFSRAYPKDKAPEDSKELKDSFVLHLNDPDTSRQLRASADYRTYTYTKILTRAQEILAANSLVRQATSSSSGGVHELQAEAEDEDESVNLIGNGECFHCQQRGHLARDCEIANRIVSRIRKNPGSWGFALAPNRRNPASQGAQGGRGGRRPGGGPPPSTPLWGNKAQNKKNNGGQFQMEPQQGR